MTAGGLELARSFYAEVVTPLLPLPHTACLIGEGSEVLGYDTERSTDHEWGPRLQIFVDDAGVEPVRKIISESLPEAHRGYPTRWFSLAEGRITDHVEVATLRAWLKKRLPTVALRPDAADWLAVPQQHLLQLTAGAVLRDDAGSLSRLRATYRWYPPDLWRWLIGAQWHLIGNATPFLGRSVEIGDLRGARLHAARICRLIMEMAFLQDRRYQPYDKWFARAFSDLEAAADLGPLIDATLDSSPIAVPDDPLYRALLVLAGRHNALAITEPVTPKITEFAVNVNDAVRPYPVLNTGDLINSTVDAISDPAIRNLPRVGSIDQLTHSDDVLINFTGWPGRLAEVYRSMLGDQK